MLRASIDIGSNTILLLVCRQKENSWEEVLNESEVTALGLGVDENKVFNSQSKEDSFNALRKYHRLITSFSIKAEEVIVTATEASRVASDSQEFFKFVKSELGFHIQIINAKGEAHYTAFGVCSNTELPESITVMDIGGASTELINVSTSPFQIKETISLPAGSVRCTEWLNQGSFESKMQALYESFDFSAYKTSHLICVAGSMTTLGAMIKGLKVFNAQDIDRSVIDFDSLKKFIGKLEKQNPDQLGQDFPVLGKRAKTIKAGALLGLSIGEKLGVKSFEISTKGLRYGTLYSGGISNEFKQL